MNVPYIRYSILEFYKSYFFFAVSLFLGTAFVFGTGAGGFIEFLKEKGQELKSEFFLPFMVDDLIKSGEKEVNVLVAEDKWYGVTYKEDLESVVSAIKGLCDQGKYKDRA